MARALNRLQYEAYLHNLLLFYGWETVEERRLAVARFVDQAHLGVARGYRRMVRDLVSEGKKRGLNAKVVNDAILKNAEHMASFASSTNVEGYWHQFDNVNQIRENLWPSSGNAKFPPEIFGGKKQDWDDLYDLHWESGSYYVHSKPVVLLQSAMRGSPTIQDDIYYDPKPLDDMITMFDHQIALFAHQCKELQKWDYLVTDHRDRAKSLRTNAIERARKVVIEVGSSSSLR